MTELDIDRDPWLAVNLSLFFPGIGQFYAGKYLRGVIFFVSQIALIGVSLGALFSPSGNTVTGLIFAFVAIAFYCCNILDAYLCVYNPRRAQIREKIPRTQKNPWFAVCISRVLPGLGHLYSGKTVLGLLLLSASLVLMSLKSFYPLLLSLSPIFAAIAIYHVYISFPKRPHLSHRSLIAVMAGLLLFWGLVSNRLPYWFHDHQFIIPSESMVPTLNIGDRVFVWQLPYYVPTRGEIIVFTPTEAIKAEDPQAQYYIKRVIATPGESVRIQDGVVYINDQPLKENYIAAPPDYQLASQVVPARAYFVLGDNRNESFDSHLWGFLPEKLIYGQAYKVFFPFERVKSLLSH